MKMVVAIIQPAKLDQVREALLAAGITRITVNRVSGHGQQQSEDSVEDLYRGQKVVPNLLHKVRLEIACNDSFVEIACEAIIRSAKEGQVGDGKIFVMPLEECIRIRTEERGGQAI